MYITIVGLERYLGIESFRVGQELILRKEPDNRYDDEAIRAETLEGVTCGYVANSVDTVARGTHSAGYFFNEIKDGKKCKIEFVVCGAVIAKLAE